MSNQGLLARRYARNWWDAHPDRSASVCDRCNGEIKRGEGYLVRYMGISLICSGCFDPSTYEACDSEAATAAAPISNLTGTTHGDPAFSADIFSMEMHDVPNWFTIVLLPLFLAGIVFGIWTGVSMSTDSDSFAGGIIIGFFGGAIISFFPVWLIIVMCRLARRVFHR